MIQISPQMRVLVAIERVDGRKGIDSLVRLCQEKLAEDPFSGCVFVFRSRSGTSIRILNYDGQGYWLAQKRLSKGKFVWWPEGSEAAKSLEAYEAQLLMAAGDVSRVRAAPMWRRVNVLKEIGIRMALGADRDDILKLVSRQGVRLVTTGVVAGVILACVLTRAIGKLLMGVSATDPATYMLVMVLLSAVTLLAGWIPARRATRVDPMQALRTE